VVTLGVNQHVAGIGTTLLLIGLSEFTNRVLYGGGALVRVPKFQQVLPDVPVLGSTPSRTSACWGGAGGLVAAAATGFGLRVRAGRREPGGRRRRRDQRGPHAVRRADPRRCADGRGRRFLTLAVLGTFTLNITSGRGWVAVALVIFARWRVWPAVLGALLFAGADALQLQLGITSAFAGVPRELLIAVPYLVVIAALAVSGRNVAYPGAYLRPYRRS
jgi:simple sugar transport system permease protein